MVWRLFCKRAEGSSDGVGDTDPQGDEPKEERMLRHGNKEMCLQQGHAF